MGMRSCGAVKCNVRQRFAHWAADIAYPRGSRFSTRQWPVYVGMRYQPPNERIADADCVSGCISIVYVYEWQKRIKIRGLPYLFSELCACIHVQAVYVTWPGARKEDTVAPKYC